MPVEQRPRRRWRGWLLAGCLLGLGCSAAAEPGPPAPGGSVADTSASGVSVHIVDGLLTLEAAGAPLGEVLRAIGAAGSFRVLTRARSRRRSACRSRASRWRGRSCSWCAGTPSS